MLTHLAIKNFATIDSLEIEFDAGLTAITGETGAGKSVILDAIGLASGARAQQHTLRDDSQAAEIIASFHYQNASDIQQWLDKYELIDTDIADNENASTGSNELIIRRIIRPDGRGRAYVNGVPVALKQLSELGKITVDLHGQHEHHSLLRTTTHQPLLDSFANLIPLSNEVRVLAKQAQAIAEQIETLSKSNADNDAKLQLLSYQVEELSNIAPQKDECAELEAEQKKLIHAESLLDNLNLAKQYCIDDEDGAALALVRRALKQLKQSVSHAPEISNAIDLLDSACIQIEEAAADIESIASDITHDPQRTAEVENRLDTLYTVARKHHCSAHELEQTLAELTEQLNALSHSDELIEDLRKQYEVLSEQYLTVASKLSSEREKAAKQLSKSVNQRLTELQMKHCRFAVSLAKRNTTTPHYDGLESTEFLISTIPGKPPQPLAKIASGGELSRVSLAIQVVTAATASVPTLVFDEVDVGIGGEVAAVVGKLLKALGNSCQVFCVTHLAQVAAKGDQHLRVSKTVTKKSALTAVSALSTEQRKAELARMVSGESITESTLAHAGDLLAPA